MIGGPLYRQGPVIPLTFSCGHSSEIRCIETTVEHVRFLESGPCDDCRRSGATRPKPDPLPALSLEDVEADYEAGQLKLF